MGQKVSIFSRSVDLCHGKYEIEIFGEPEISRYEKCTKIDGHKGMKTLLEFTKEDIPAIYNEHRNIIYKLVLSLANLTVRISNKYVSYNRPEFIPGTKHEYPFYKYRGQNINIVGTGRVCDVVRRTTGDCKCRKSSITGLPSRVWWAIKIFTATHVVFDDEEARATTCTLFYDDDQKKETNVDLIGCREIRSDISGDLCLLETYTCDKKLVRKLFAKIKRFNGYWTSLKHLHGGNKGKWKEKNGVNCQVKEQEKCFGKNKRKAQEKSQMKSQEKSQERDQMKGPEKFQEQGQIKGQKKGRMQDQLKALAKSQQKDHVREKLVVIVSHPHGGAKRISIGHGVDIGKELKFRYSKFIYNTSTCSGSSGAPVYVLGIDWFQTEYVHGGTLLKPIEYVEAADKPQVTLITSADDQTELFPKDECPSVTLVSYSSIYTNVTSDVNKDEEDIEKGINSSDTTNQSDSGDDEKLQRLPESQPNVNFEIPLKTISRIKRAVNRMNELFVDRISESNVDLTMQESHLSYSKKYPMFDGASNLVKYAKYRNYSAWWY